MPTWTRSLPAVLAAATLGLPARAEWQVETSINPIDDTTTVALRQQDALGSAAQLLIRCRSGEIELSVDWKRPLPSGHPLLASVATRIGQDPAVEIPWVRGSDGGGVIFYQGDVADLIRLRLRKADRLALEVRGRSTTPLVAAFDLSDLDSRLEPLQRECSLLPPSQIAGGNCRVFDYRVIGGTRLPTVRPKSSVNLRSQPTTRAPVLVTITRDEVLSVLEACADWIRVAHSYREAWVSGAHVCVPDFSVEAIKDFRRMAADPDRPDSDRRSLIAAAEARDHLGIPECD